jgi:hypothetical protein
MRQKEIRLRQAVGPTNDKKLGRFRPINCAEARIEGREHRWLGRTVKGVLVADARALDPAKIRLPLALDPASVASAAENNGLAVEPLANASGCRAREGERHQLRHHRSVSGAGFQRRGFSAFRPLLGFRRSGRVDLLPSARAASDDTQRDAIYRRNIDPGERVVASLLQFRPDSEALGHWCRLEREQDGSIIAEVLTVRALATSR